MSDAYRPLGRLVDMAEAVRMSGKSLRSVQRWVLLEYVRTHPDQHGDEKLSELDVIAMRDKRWTRNRSTA